MNRPDSESEGEKMAVTMRTRIVMSIIGCAVLVEPSYAYLDPGTGSIILQSLLAGIAVAFGMLRLYWHRLKTFLSGLSRRSIERETRDEKEFEQDSEIHNKP